jgi:hypothetical protein
MKYWLIKINERHHDYSKIEEGSIYEWAIDRQSKRNPIEGDKLIIISSDYKTIYATASVISLPYIIKAKKNKVVFGRSPNSDKIAHQGVKIKINKKYGLKTDKFPYEIMKKSSKSFKFEIDSSEFNAIENITSTNSPGNYTLPNLNTILYGPPGTGKTYITILRAAEIIENRKIDSYDEALKIFKENLHNRIEFITFHQNYSYEDFIQGLRPETDNKSVLTFDKKDGVFKKIADRAKQNSYFIPVGTELKDYKVIKSNDDIIELWSEKTSSIRYVPPQLIIDLLEGIKSKKITLEDIRKRRLIDLPELINSKVEKYYFGIEGTLYNICEYLLEKGMFIQKMNYVIVIDEINRANISRVFGELITLIEPDKRSNGSIPLQVKLPSGDTFGVPTNLFIIGTMNTADKSIALLDIALRRRFEFESMYPLYEIEGSEIYDKDILLKINEQIIESKGHDFQIGHAYFMGENKDLKERMNKKVIPLLLEYFMNERKEVESILFNAGLQVEKNSWPIKITGKRV